MSKGRLTAVSKETKEQRDLSSTRIGVIRFHYSREVAIRPFSLFSQVESEQKANRAWAKKADEWGERNVDAHGNRVTLELDKDII